MLLTNKTAEVQNDDNNNKKKECSIDRFLSSVSFQDKKAFKQASFDFDAIESDELRLHKGDIIAVIDKSDPNWLRMPMTIIGGGKPSYNTIDVLEH